MGSLTTCLREAREFLAENIHDGILKRAAELRANGSSADEAKMVATREALQVVRDARAEVETAKAEGRSLYEPLPPDQQPKPPAQPEQPARAAALDADPIVAKAMQIEAANPSMQVGRDEFGGQVTAADLMEQARREAMEGTDDELGMLDADLLKVAADCALSTWS